MKTRSIKLTRATLTWIGLGALLIGGGFLVDGSTEIGHHALLICGGLAIGWGGRKEVKS